MTGNGMAQNPIRLRAHHLLCIRFFAGHGYSPAFTQNMERVIAALNDGAPVRLVRGMDDLCAACPNNAPSASCCGGEGEAECTAEEKVSRYDRAVRSALESSGLDTAAAHPWHELYAAITERIMRSHPDGTRAFDAICPDCQWRALCG